MFFSRSGLTSILCSNLIRVEHGMTVMLGAANNRLGKYQPWQMERRHISGLTGEIPAVVKPILYYGSDAYVTKGLESIIQILQSTGMTPIVSFIAMGLGLRLATAPLHIYAEKLVAKRFHVVNFLTQNILKKASEKYDLKIISNPKTSQIALDTKDQTIKEKVQKILTKQISDYSTTHGLQRSRILNLKVLATPVWFYSSFAIRNTIAGGFTPMMHGFLWLPNLCQPDPLWIVPICVGLIGGFNLYTQRLMQPTHSMSQNVMDGLVVLTMIFAIKMMTVLPVCIPMYWLIVSVTGLAQNLMLRHPKVKKLLGINRLPYDSNTPLRDILLRRKRKVPSPLL